MEPTIHTSSKKFHSARCSRIPGMFEALGTTPKEKEMLKVVGSVLANICDEVTGLTRTIRGVNSHDGLVSKVTALEAQGQEVSEKLDSLIDEVKELHSKVDRRRATDQKKSVREYLTWEQVMVVFFKYVFQPIFVAVMIWLMTQWFPRTTGPLFP